MLAIYINLNGFAGIFGLDKKQWMEYGPVLMLTLGLAKALLTSLPEDLNI
jgi:hypothetical protein